MLSDLEMVSWGRGRINDLAWTPDGSKLIVTTDLGLYLCDGKGLGAEQLLTESRIQQMLPTVDERLIIATEQAVALRQLTHTDRRAELVVFASPPVTTAFNTDATLVAVDQGDCVVIYSLLTGGIIVALPTSSLGCRGSIVFSRDQKRIAIATGRAVELWHLTEARRIASFDAGEQLVVGLAFLPDDQRMVIATTEAVRCWNTLNEHITALVSGLPDPIQVMALSVDGQTLLISSGQQLLVYTWRDQRVIASISLSTGSLRALAIHPQTQQVALAIRNGIELRNLADGSCTDRADGYWGSINSVACSPRGQIVAAVADYGYLLSISSTVPSEQLLPLAELSGRISSVTFAPDGRLVALADATSIYVYQVADGQLCYRLMASLAQADALRFSADGSLLIAITIAGLTFWCASDGAALHRATLSVTDDDLILAPDGESFALLTLSAVQVYNIHAEQPYWVVSASQSINAAALSCNGTLLAVATDSATWLWQQGVQEVIAMLPGSAQRLTFSADGSLLAIVNDTTISIWRVSDGSLLAVLDGHQEMITSLAFAADGNRLLSGGRDGTLRLWQWPDDWSSHSDRL